MTLVADKPQVAEKQASNPQEQQVASALPPLGALREVQRDLGVGAADAKRILQGQTAPAQAPRQGPESPLPPGFVRSVW